MKGLLAKDMALLLQRKRFFLAAVAVAFFMVFFTDAGSFVSVWMVIMTGIFSISTISYDEYDNSMPFLMSMPVTGKIYAIEKYILLVLFGAAAVGISILMLIASSLAGNSVNLGECLSSALISMSLVLIFVSLSLPAMMKWGTEKGRLFLVILAAIVLALFYLCDASIIGLNGSSILYRLGIYKLTAVSMLAAAVVIVVSALISVQVMENKEF